MEEILLRRELKSSRVNCCVVIFSFGLLYQENEKKNKNLVRRASETVWCECNKSTLKGIGIIIWALQRHPGHEGCTQEAADPVLYIQNEIFCHILFSKKFKYFYFSPN